MQLLKKISAGLFLLIGVPIVLIALLGILNPSATDQEREENLLVLIILGLPPTALGSWFAWSLHQASKESAQALEREKEQLLLQLVKKQGGTVTVLQFATEAKIPFTEAQTYLDQKATEMNASIDVTDSGGIIYNFGHC
jgi:cadmium resistance protein CadD (predicted permease)